MATLRCILHVLLSRTSLGGKVSKEVSKIGVQQTDMHPRNLKTFQVNL